MRVKIDKAEQEIPKQSSGQRLEQLLSQNDALRLAKETAFRSREADPSDLQELYEKVVPDEISIPEYTFTFVKNSVKQPAYANVLKEINANLGRFI
jgi:hypothetical protein